jgi:glucose/arabinose dehydrogenase
MKSTINKRLVKIVLVCLAVALTYCHSSRQTGLPGLVPDNDDGGLVLPEGFHALVVADNLGRGRHIDINENGDIYMALRRPNDGHGIVALRDNTGDGRFDEVKYFGNYAGTGMEIHDNWLYFGEDTMILRYRMIPGELVPDSVPEIVIRGFPVQNQHSDKSFAIDTHGYIYVNVGAPSNACMEQARTKGSPGMYPCPQLEWHAGIWRFPLDQINQTQTGNGYHYATGMRNSIAISWNKLEDQLYVVMHGRDQLSQLFPELYTDAMSAELPAEEFLLVKDGSDFGWPYCYYDQFKKKLVTAPEYGGDGEKTDLAEGKDDPIMAFPGHLAPNDLLFYTGDQFPARYKNGAFICFHGSWNRAPLEQEGYYVAFVPFSDGLPSGDWEIFADSFAGKMPVKSPADAEYRPMGIVMGKDGSLYVCDSEKGKIWRIIYTGE